MAARLWDGGANASTALRAQVEKDAMATAPSRYVDVATFIIQVKVDISFDENENKQRTLCDFCSKMNYSKNSRDS